MTNYQFIEFEYHKARLYFDYNVCEDQSREYGNQRDTFHLLELCSKSF